MFSESPRSAIILATLKILSYALAEKPRNSIAVLSSLPPASLSWQNLRCMDEDICAFSHVSID
jgi:hypothetical protein